MFDLYAIIRHNADQSLLEVSKCLKEMLDCEAMVLEQSVCGFICGVAGDVQKSFVDASGVADKSVH